MEDRSGRYDYNCIILHSSFKHLLKKIFDKKYLCDISYCMVSV